MKYKSIIDLTAKGREQEKQGEQPQLQEPEDALASLTLSKLPKALRDSVKAMGWDSLMPVQSHTIPYMLQERDVIVQSRTGSGKTGAFLLPLMKLLDPERGVVQALVLVPTRELARQVHGEFERMRAGSPKTEALGAALVYGGVGYAPQVKALQEGADLVVGTPGRVLDLLERGTLSLDGLRILILDEADEMLSMGFYPAMRELKRYLPRERRSYMFSATMPYRVRQLGEEFLREPGFLSLSTGQVHVETMEHRYYLVPPMEKDRVLVRLIELENPESAIIFANTKREVEYLAQFLRNYGYDAGEISGDLTQTSREEVMDRVRRGKLRFLVATDVAARGIDISDLSHVFMYDVPQDPEYYIHRAGRTARAGKTGVAVVLATRQDERSLLDIQRRYDINLEKRPVPEAEEVEGRVAQRVTVLLEDRLREKSNLERERLQRFLPLAHRIVQEGEPELLALLLDEVYHQSLHRAAAAPGEAPPAPERLEQSGRGRGRSGRRGPRE